MEMIFCLPVGDLGSPAAAGENGAVPLGERGDLWLSLLFWGDSFIRFTTSSESWNTPTWERNQPSQHFMCRYFTGKASPLLVPVLLQKYWQLRHFNTKVLQIHVVNICTFTLHLKKHTLSVSDKISNLLTVKASLDDESSTNTNEGGEHC